MAEEKKPRILVVDDEEMIYKDVSRTLEREGFQVDYKPSGEKCLQFLKDNPDIDIVILDINMGSGLNGVDTLKEIKKSFKDVQVIMHTGEQDIKTGIECMTNGAYDYLNKPFDKDKFLAKARGALEAKELAQIAEKLTSVGGMAEGLVHQIKNRLATFSTAATAQGMIIADFQKKHGDLAEKYPEIKAMVEKIERFSKIISSDVKRTSDTIRGIMNFADTSSKELSFTTFSLQDIIPPSVEVLLIKHKASKLPLTIETDGSDTLYGVRTQLQEVFYNIIDNCYEAIKERVAGDAGLEPEIRLALRKDEPDKLYRIEVSDNGTGIKEENKYKVFMPFFSTKGKENKVSGSGIGMCVVKRIIEGNHKGKIYFESEYGKGTKFFIELPMQQ